VSGAAVGHALERRFEEVRRAETDRLRRKLAALSPGDRVLAEAIIADVIGALARVPAAALSRADPPPALDAVVHLFGLEVLA
jgi:Glutamyl-tRNAGlu reductase, dimerisation domain